jgi:ABC-type transport system involved in multi-copper enzyme maturation permease subunit
MSDTTVLGGVEGSLAMARVTLLRLIRGRALWVVSALSLLPLLYALLALQEPDLEDWRDVVKIWLPLLGVLPPMVLATAIGEEVEERTMTYLWSRPLPRWSIVLGKMAALVPILWAALAAALLLPLLAWLGGAGAPAALFGRLALTVMAGTLAASAVTAGLATLAPRISTVLAMGYLLFIDLPLTATDATISRLSVTSNALELADVGAVAPALAWLAGITAVWLTVAVWRIRRLE